MTWARAAPGGPDLLLLFSDGSRKDGTGPKDGKLRGPHTDGSGVWLITLGCTGRARLPPSIMQV